MKLFSSEISQENIDAVKVNLLVKYLTFWIGLTITAIMAIAVKVFIPETPIKDIVAVITAGVVCTTLLYHAKNLELNYEANLAKLKSDKEVNTIKLSSDRKMFSINLISDWHKHENIKYTIIARDFLIRNLKTQSDELMKLLEKEENMNARIGIVSILNYLEKIALAIMFDAAEEEILKDFFKGIFNFYAHTARVFIDARRTEKQDGLLFGRFEEINRRCNS